MKVGKEEILRLFTTVDTFLKGTDEGDRAAWERQARTVAEVLAEIDRVEALVMTEGQLAMPYSGTPHVCRFRGPSPNSERDICFERGRPKHRSQAIWERCRRRPDDDASRR